MVSSCSFRTSKIKKLQRIRNQNGIGHLRNNSLFVDSRDNRKTAFAFKILSENHFDFEFELYQLLSVRVYFANFLKCLKIYLPSILWHIVFQKMSTAIFLVSFALPEPCHSVIKRKSLFSFPWMWLRFCNCLNKSNIAEVNDCSS